MNLREAIEYMKKGGKIRKKNENDRYYYYDSESKHRFRIYLRSEKENIVTHFIITDMSDFYDDIWEKYTPVLDDIEKRYIEAVITPFKDKVICITKESAGDRRQGLANIVIRLESKYIVPFEEITLPIFPNYDKGMYKNMQTGRTYTLGELDL